MLPLGALGFVVIVTQSGCPGGAELENPDAWAGRFGQMGSGAASGGMGPILDFSTIQCTNTTPQALLNGKCATNFCHGANFAADLDLRPNDGFAARLKDKPATFADIPCPNGQSGDCIPDSCPKGAAIVDSDAPASSWMLLKLSAPNGCGEQMPSGKMATADDVACLTQIVNAVAALH